MVASILMSFATVHLASRASSSRITLVRDVVHRARKVAMRDELLDKVQRQVYQSCPPGFHGHPQDGQQAWTKPTFN